MKKDKNLWKILPKIKHDEIIYSKYIYLNMQIIKSIKVKTKNTNTKNEKNR